MRKLTNTCVGEGTNMQKIKTKLIHRYHFS